MDTYGRDNFYTADEMTDISCTEQFILCVGSIWYTNIVYNISNTLKFVAEISLTREIFAETLLRQNFKKLSINSSFVVRPIYCMETTSLCQWVNVLMAYK